MFLLIFGEVICFFLYLFCPFIDWNKDFGKLRYLLKHHLKKTKKQVVRFKMKLLFSKLLDENQKKSKS